MDQPRKATDVLLEILSKVDYLVSQVNSLNLRMGIISNKLNENKSVSPTPQNKIIIEAVNNSPVINQRPIPNDPVKQIPIMAEQKLPEEVAPTGFRRTSRPETFSGDDSYLKQPKKKEPTARFPVQIPKADGQSEVIIPKAVTNEIVPKEKIAKTDNEKQIISNINNVPTIQRIVDRNGKSVFLADVEILDANTADKIFTTRTNGTGKWQASLPHGHYKVIVRKRESLTKDKLEIIQNIVVDGSKSPLELNMMIIK